jgi:hypothetical protein
MDQQQVQQTAGNQQQFMQQPPFVISTKDLMYLEDMMSWNLNVIKKVNYFAQHVKDQEIQNRLHQMCQMHENHYQKLLNHMHQHLQTTQQQQMPGGGMQS